MSLGTFGCGALSAFLIAVAPSYARANDPQPLFVCGSGPDAAPTNLFELKGVLQPNGDWDGLQFTGFGEGMEPVYFPSEPGAGRDKFFFSNSIGPDGYLVNVRFKSGKNAYRLYSLSVLPKTGGNDRGDSEAGLEITGPDGKARKITCDERPYMFIAYIREAMSCDSSNPYGAAGCDYSNVPQRKPGDQLR